MCINNRGREGGCIEVKHLLRLRNGAGALFQEEIDDLLYTDELWKCRVQKNV